MIIIEQLPYISANQPLDYTNINISISLDLIIGWDSYLLSVNFLNGITQEIPIVTKHHNLYFQSNSGELSRKIYLVNNKFVNLGEVIRLGYTYQNQRLSLLNKVMLRKHIYYNQNQSLRLF